MKKNRTLFNVFFGGIIILAGLADLKYKGKLYQILPSTVQNSVDTYLNKRSSE